MGKQVCPRDWLIPALTFLFYPLCPEVFPTQTNQLRFHAWRVLARTVLRATGEQRSKTGDPWPSCRSLAAELSVVLKGAQLGPALLPPHTVHMWSKQILAYLKY